MKENQYLSFGLYRLDSEHGQLWRETQDVKLTPKALAVLRFLVERPGQVVTKEEFFQSVWAETVVSDAALTSCIQELRQALRDDARKPRYIETVHRRGFRFLAPVTAQANGSAPHVEPIEAPLTPVLPLFSPPAVPDDSFPLPPVPASPTAEVEKAQEPLSADPSLLPSPSAPTRFPPVRNLILVGLALLVGVMVAVQYLSLPAPNPQSLPPSPQPLPLPDKPSIVVLPFVNLSEDPKQEYFSDGITEDLTSDLSQLSNLFVIARHSAFTYKGKAVKVQDVSKELGVRYVLEGSVRKADDQVRISAQLIDATTGAHLWAGSGMIARSRTSLPCRMRSCRRSWRICGSRCGKPSSRGCAAFLRTT